MTGDLEQCWRSGHVSRVILKYSIWTRNALAFFFSVYLLWFLSSLFLSLFPSPHPPSPSRVFCSTYGHQYISSLSIHVGTVISVPHTSFFFRRAYEPSLNPVTTIFTPVGFLGWTKIRSRYGSTWSRLILTSSMLTHLTRLVTTRYNSARARLEYGGKLLAKIKIKINKNHYWEIAYFITKHCLLPFVNGTTIFSGCFPCLDARIHRQGSKTWGLGNISGSIWTK